MARTKKTSRDKLREARRTTLTKFRLSRYAKWPNWTNPAIPTSKANLSDDDIWEEPDNTRQVHDMTMKEYYHGPLAHLDGVMKVRVARTVGDIEDAVFIILWKSADHVKTFQQSPELHGPFLRGLGLPLPGESETSPFDAILQFDRGFPIGERDEYPDGIDGRITLIIMDIPYLKTDGPDHAGWRKILDSGPGSLGDMDDYVNPADEEEEYMGPGEGFPWPRWFSSSEAYTYLVPAVPAVDRAEEEGKEDEDEMLTAVCYLFQRWDFAPEVREKEAELFGGGPGGKEKIAEAMSKAMPLVRSWRVERWDVQVAPCCFELCGSLDEAEVGPPERDPVTSGSLICAIPARR